MSDTILTFGAPEDGYPPGHGHAEPYGVHLDVSRPEEAQLVVDLVAASGALAPGADIVGVLRAAPAGGA